MYTTDAPEAGWDGCVFCAIAKGQAEASVVYEDTIAIGAAWEGRERSLLDADAEAVRTALTTGLGEARPPAQLRALAAELSRRGGTRRSRLALRAG
jgi:hypothetical protein